MTKTLTSLLVGSHFNPPAKTLLAHLPARCPLTLEPDPENPYDPEAIKVMLSPEAVPESQYEALAAALPLQGCTIEQLMSGGLVQLGHVARSGGKPLLQAEAKLGQRFAGNAEFADWIKDPLHEAVLGFAADGSPLVHLRIDVPEEESAT